MHSCIYLIFSYNLGLVEALFWWNLEFIGRIVVCVKDRTAAGISGHLPLNTWRNNNVVTTSKRRHFDVITSKWRRLDVITTSLLRNVFAGLIGRNSWCEPGSGARLKSIKSVCSQWSGAVLDLALPGEHGGWNWSLAGSDAGEKARRPGYNQNVISVIFIFG